MPKKLLISVVAILILLGGAIFVWQKKTIETQNLPESQENVQSSDEEKEMQSKTLDDLLAQAEEVQLSKVDTAGWLTYRDEKLGIEFMYPKGWEVRSVVYTENGDGYLCIKTTDDRFAKIPTSSAIVLQGTECVFDIRKSSGLDDVEFSLKNFPNASLAELIGSNRSQGRTITLRTKSDTTIFSFYNNNLVTKLHIWEMDRELLNADSVLQNLIQTLKPIQK